MSEFKGTSGLEDLAVRCVDAAIEHAEIALDTHNWPYACEAMEFAANCITVATSLRAQAAIAKALQS